MFKGIEYSEVKKGNMFVLFQTLSTWRWHVSCHHANAEPVHRSRHGSSCCYCATRIKGAVLCRGLLHRQTHSKHTDTHIFALVHVDFDALCSAGSGHFVNMEESWAAAAQRVPYTAGPSYSWNSGSHTAADCQDGGIWGSAANSGGLLLNASTSLCVSGTPCNWALQWQNRLLYFGFWVCTKNILHRMCVATKLFAVDVNNLRQFKRIRFN